MYQRGQFHLHHKHRPSAVDGLVPWWGHRALTDDGGDNGGGSDGGSGGGGKTVTMTQAAFDAIVRDAKSQARRSERQEIEAKYGDLKALKAKAEAAESGDTQAQKDLEAAQKTIEDLTTKVEGFEADQKKAERIKMVQEALKAAEMKPELAEVLNLKGETPEDLAAELEAVKPVVGATPVPPKQPIGGGGNPAGAGGAPPADLSEAIGAHYEGK